MNCKQCNHDWSVNKGCRPIKWYIDRNGVTYDPIKVGYPEDWGYDEPEDYVCPDCGAPKWAQHHMGCDAERCPRCGGQLIMCMCMKGAEYEWVDS